jgi:phage shock protein A
LAEVAAISIAEGSTQEREPPFSCREGGRGIRLRESLLREAGKRKKGGQAMGILDRIGRLVRTNLHELIESATSAERALEKHVEEMEEDLADARTLLVSTRRQEVQIASRIRLRETEAHSWQSRAEAAVRAGKDTVAREAVRRKLEAEQRIADLREEHEQVTARLSELERSIEPLEARLAEARAQLNRLIREREYADRDREFETLSAKVKGATEEKSERFEEEIQETKFRADAIREMSDSSLEARFDVLEGPNDEIEAELARIRENLESKPRASKNKGGPRKD